MTQLPRRSPLFLYVSLLFCARLVAAAFRTIAIDDTYGDEATGALPAYSPPASWSQGTPCTLDDDSCLVNPDPSMARNGTWHDSVGTTDDAPPRTIDLAFEGNSIAVYCIVSEVDRVEIAVSNMTFELDGQQAGKFYHDVSGKTDASGNYDIQYNVRVFNGSVPEGKHTLRINSVGYSRMLFDYALYTTSSDLGNGTVSPSSASPAASTVPGDISSKSHIGVGVIAGAVAAGVAAIVGGCVAIFLLLRNRKRSRSPFGSGREISKAKSKPKSFAFVGQDDSGAASSVISLPYTESTHSSHPYAYSPHSRYHDGQEESSESGAPSPSDSSVPLILETPAMDADPFARGQQSRIVVVGTETRLEGPDNSMARLARKQVAEREVELTRRVRELERALAARRPAGDLPGEVHSSNASLTTPPDHSVTPVMPLAASSSRPSPGGSESETVLRQELDELRAEMGRMRMIQQQMDLELREAFEQPPLYQES
ncbi:hypothetical protein C8Q77DRAFT_1243262 [Trametes polyzona]|nr:hypothetical protein C8Q77DRAFT_1243262 [Trametes polyzona]